MKNVFISSVIQGFEEYRAAAKRAVELLYFEPVMSESFGARPYSPEKACITGVEESDIYLLILGEVYGYETNEGISVTQSEFRAAKAAGKSILVFIQNIEMVTKQQAFKKEVEHFHEGFFRESFSTPEELKDKIVSALHLSQQLRNTISDEDFESIINEKIGESNNTFPGYNAELILVFYSQPARDRDLDEIEHKVDEVFQKLCDLNIATLADGYTRIPDRDRVGLKTGKISLIYYEDGLIILKADPTAQNSGPNSTYFVPPAEIERYCNAFQHFVEENSGYMHFELRNMSYKYVSEPVTGNSLSIPTNDLNTFSENKLFIPFTVESYMHWTEGCIKKSKRRFKNE